MSLKASRGSSIKINGVASKKVCSYKQGLSFRTDKGDSWDTLGPSPCTLHAELASSSAFCCPVSGSASFISGLLSPRPRRRGTLPGRRGRAARSDMRAQREWVGRMENSLPDCPGRKQPFSAPQRLGFTAPFSCAAGYASLLADWEADYFWSRYFNNKMSCEVEAPILQTFFF